MGRTAGEMLTIMRKRPDECPVCVYVVGQMRAHIDTVFYEQVTDVQVRARIRAAGGFCRYHAEMVSDQGDALGTALVMHDLLVNELRSLRGTEPRSGISAFGRLLGGKSGTERPPCSFCEAEVEMEEIAVDSVMESMATDESFGAALSSTRGLCIPHFRLTSERSRNPSAWTQIRAVQLQALERLADELHTLTLSFDHNLRGKVPDVDNESWRRGLAVTSGKYD